jgi:hypothetical protein
MFYRHFKIFILLVYSGAENGFLQYLFSLKRNHKRLVSVLIDSIFLFCAFMGVMFVRLGDFEWFKINVSLTVNATLHHGIS